MRTVLVILYLFMYLDLKYKEDAFIFMSFYFVNVLLCMGIFQTV